MKSIEEVLYEFDIFGYAILEQVLDREALGRMNGFWSSHLANRPLHDVDFSWGRDWSALVDHPRIYEVMSAIYAHRFRLDHMFCVDERFVSSAGSLHHHADMFEEGIFYGVTNGKIHCGLTAVQFALSDTGCDVNHFCCIPGSHRANFPTPERYQQSSSCEILAHLTLRAGDALIFSEALVHGTFRVGASSPRRAVFGRYTNSHSYYRRPPDHAIISALPPTPNHGSGVVTLIDSEALSPRQRSLVMEPAYARARPPLSENDR